jgi:acetyl esterase/lipase
MAHDSVLLWPEGAPGALGAGGEDQPRLTPYLPERVKPSAAVIVCPGGGYCNRAPHEGEPVARWLAGLGVAAFVLDYRVSPYRHPIPLGDAQRAIRMIRARHSEWLIDPDRVGILGFSAGGHLAASAATIFDDGNSGTADSVDHYSCRPNALIACYPVITFGEFRHHGSMINLLGDEPNNPLQEYMSLENRVTDQTPPAFLWHTSDDAGVPVENSLLFAAALRKHSVPFALHVFPKGQHGLGLAKEVPYVREWPKLCENWLGEIGFV